MQTIIGLGGKKQSGKDETAIALRALLAPTGVHRVAFADALKSEVASACGVTVPFIEEHKSNFRLILQGWGTDFRRKLGGKNYWIDRTCERIDSLPHDAIVVVTDVRFPNEAEMIQNLGGWVWKVERPSLEASQAADSHASETAMDLWEWDEVIVNDGNLEDLRGKATKAWYGVSGPGPAAWAKAGVATT